MSSYDPVREARRRQKQNSSNVTLCGLLIVFFLAAFNVSFKVLVSAINEVEYVNGIEEEQPVNAEVFLIDPVTEIGPWSSGKPRWILCYCKTLENDYIPVCISPDDYKAYFDSSANFLKNIELLPHCTFAPSIIHGTLYRADFVSSELQEDYVMLFKSTDESYRTAIIFSVGFFASIGIVIFYLVLKVWKNHRRKAQIKKTVLKSLKEDAHYNKLRRELLRELTFREQFRLFASLYPLLNLEQCNTLLSELDVMVRFEIEEQLRR